MTIRSNNSWQVWRDCADKVAHTDIPRPQNRVELKHAHNGSPGQKVRQMTYNHLAVVTLTLSMNAAAPD